MFIKRGDPKCTAHGCVSNLTQGAGVLSAGSLIINADDWGQDVNTTNAILSCTQGGPVTAVSAMVFMEDSERAAALAMEQNIDSGLHLNLTTPFTARQSLQKLNESQGRVAKYLLSHRFAQAVFHPGLMRDFEYVVIAQIEEFERLYRKVPARIDGHHHMHLCQNVLLQNILPKGIRIRRHFSFLPGEKIIWNRGYRGTINWFLSRRYRMADYFFAIPPLGATERLRRIVDLGRRYIVEVAVHPVKVEEYRSLLLWDGWPGTVSLPDLKQSPLSGRRGSDGGN